MLGGHDLLLGASEDCGSSPSPGVPANLAARRLAAHTTATSAARNRKGSIPEAGAHSACLAHQAGPRWCTWNRRAWAVKAALSPKCSPHANQKVFSVRMNPLTRAVGDRLCSARGVYHGGRPAPIRLNRWHPAADPAARSTATGTVPISRLSAGF